MKSNIKNSLFVSILQGKSSKKNQGYLFFSTIFIVVILIVISVIKFDNPYFMLRESVSSLGIKSENPNGYIFFRIALIISGLTFIPYFIYIYRIFHPTAYHTSRSALVLSIISCICIIGVGIFPEDNPIPHYTNAIIAFIGFTTVFSCYLYIFIKKVIQKDSWPKIWQIVLLYVTFYGALIGFLIVMFLFWLYYYHSIIFINFSLPLWEWILVMGIFSWIIGNFIIIPNKEE
ncbi:MAG: hypothetical protein ACTSQ5_07270 [Promethearchaeota archaeon]